MKRIIATLFAAVLCLALAAPVFAAEYTVGGNGDAVYDTAVGYVFDIDDVNGAIEGEDATVITNNEALASIGSKWAIWFTAEKRSANIYEVITDGVAMGGTAPDVTLSEGRILIAVHSSTSNPAQADLYPNWEDKVAALAVKKGEFIAFSSGIDLENGTGSGMMLVLTKEEVDAGTVVFPEEDDPAVTPDESSASDSETASSEDSLEEPEDSVGADVSKETTETVMDNSDRNDSDVFDILFWVIIAVLVTAIIVVVVLIIVKSRK